MKDDSISRKKALDTVRAMCDRCDTGDVLDYRDLMLEAFEALPSARPSATDTNVATTDTISRQAAVSGISDLLMLELKGERLPTYNEVYRAIYDLPSAEPVAKDICVPVKDCISRQAVIDGGSGT